MLIYIYKTKIVLRHLVPHHQIRILAYEEVQIP